MLEPSFLSNVTKWNYADPELERLLLKVCGSAYHVLIVCSIVLLYLNPGTGH